MLAGQSVPNYSLEQSDSDYNPAVSLLQARPQEVRYWGSTDQLSEESSAETDQLHDHLEEKTVAAREVSEDSKQVQEDNPEI